MAHDINLISALLILVGMSLMFYSAVRRYQKGEYRDLARHIGKGRVRGAMFIELGLPWVALISTLVALFNDDLIRRVIFNAVSKASSLSATSRPSFTAIAIALSMALFTLRKKARRIYGVLEVFFGFLGIIAYPVAPKAEGVMEAATAAWLLGYMSLIYIVIRGFDNVDVGIGLARKAAEEKRASPVVGNDAVSRELVGTMSGL